jgi:hypothetical protein
MPAGSIVSADGGEKQPGRFRGQQRWWLSPGKCDGPAHATTLARARSVT